MRKLFLAALILLLALVSIESLSSYILYRRFAWHDKTFEPSGSATLDLYSHIMPKRAVTASVDHGPLFKGDPELGHGLFPGSYRITERNRGRQLFFSMTVDSHGHRATAYLDKPGRPRILITGDSAFFGWSVDDESTAAWLLQTRLPDYEVVNLSLTSYSTVHALLQLERIVPPLGADDIVVLSYHPVTNEFNAGSEMILKPLIGGFEAQLGDPNIPLMRFPYGVVDNSGKLEIKRIALSCSTTPARPECAHPDIAYEAGERITKAALDEALVRLAGHRVLLVVLGGKANDRVVQHARERGVNILDLRALETPADSDVNVVDGHVGPIWQHFAYRNLLAELIKQQWVH